MAPRHYQRKNTTVAADLLPVKEVRKVLLLTPLFAIDPNNYGMQNRHTKKADFRLKVSLDTL